jgi:hypothetical protein
MDIYMVYSLPSSALLIPASLVVSRRAAWWPIALGVAINHPLDTFVTLPLIEAPIFPYMIIFKPSC